MSELISQRFVGLLELPWIGWGQTPGSAQAEHGRQSAHFFNYGVELCRIKEKRLRGSSTFVSFVPDSRPCCLHKAIGTLIGS